MLKGKKKALAAQVLLGLMVAGNAYAADFTVEGVAGESWGEVASADSEGAKYQKYACNVDSKPLLGPGGAFNPGVLEDGKSVVSDYNIKLDVNLAGSLDRNFLLNADIVKNNKISFGVGYPRGYQNWSGSTWNVFKPDVSKDNTLELGVIFNDKHNDETGALENSLENINVGDDNDIVLAGGRVKDYLEVEYVADYKDINFTGRNLTLEDADGTEEIKSANMKGDITAARHLTAESLTADGTITANGGLTVGTVEAKALNGGAVEATNVTAKDINVASLEAKAVDATNINVIGLLKEKTAVAAAPAMFARTRAARAVSGINAKNINAGRIEATNVTAGSIVAGSISATTVKANDVTLNNGDSIVGTMTTGSLNITGNGSLNVTDINVNDIKITSITPGTALTVNGTIKDKSGNDKSLGDVFKTTVTEENTALFNTSYESKAEGNKIVTKANGTKIREQSKSYVETQMAALAMVASGADLLANAGFTNAAQAVQDAKDSGDSGRSMVPYAAANYGSMRQESGSHVDVKGSNFNIGFAKEVKNGSGKLLFGPMFEYGRGNYDSYLDDGTTGSGTAQNYGIGMMARQTNDNGFYYEGSVRYGKVTSDYSSSNVLAGKDVSYDNSAKYWGAHVGVGKLQKLGGDNAIDLYGKLFYTNQGSSSVNIDGDTLDFSSVKSKRSRIGFRYIHGTSDVRSVYAGLAWQYEFDGAAHATANGFSTPSPSVKGSSGMLELGVLIAPKASPVSFDLGVSGWAGKQKGYSLNANMLWSF